MSRRIRFRPSSRENIRRRSEEETRQSIETAISQLGRYTPRGQEPVYEIGTTLPSDHPLVEARERREQGRPRRQGLSTVMYDSLGFLPGRVTDMHGYTGYGRSIHGRSLPSRNEGERVERERPVHLSFNAEDTTFYNPKFYEVDPDQVKNTMDMVKVFRALLGKITLDEETVKKYGLEHYVKEK